MPNNLDYRQLLQKLLPPGSAFNREDQTKLADMLLAISDEWGRVDDMIARVLTEADPREAVLLLTDWERITGLPDDCVMQIGTLQERRNAVALRLGTLGGQSAAYLIYLASLAGFTITITEFKPFVAGSNAGDYLTNGDWQNTFRVNAPSQTVRYFTAGSLTGESLASWGNQLLECIINRVKPAHTIVQYAYGS